MGRGPGQRSGPTLAAKIMPRIGRTPSHPNQTFETQPRQPASTKTRSIRAVQSAIVTAFRAADSLRFEGLAGPPTLSARTPFASLRSRLAIPLNLNKNSFLGHFIRRQPSLAAAPYRAYR